MPRIIRETDDGLVMENQHLVVRFFHQTPRMEVYDRRIDFHWVQSDATSLRLREYFRQEDHVAAFLHTAGGLEMLAVWELEENLPELRFRLSPRQETSFDSFTYPAPFLLGAGSAVIPHSQGMIYPLDDVPIQRFLQGQFLDASAADLSMPWFGLVGTPSAHGCLMILETPNDASITFGQHPWRHGTLLTVQPAWRSARRRMAYDRSARIWFHVEGGYVSQAKRYQMYLKERGAAFGVPDGGGSASAGADRLRGACHLSFHVGELTFDDVGKACQRLHQAGVDRAVVHLRSWQDRPYESPRLTPPSALAGGPEGLRRLAQSLSALGYVPGIAAGFRETYDGFDGYAEREVLRDSSGAPVSGGYWGISRVPSTRVCGRCQPGLARAHLPQAVQAGPFQSVLLDGVGAELRECSDADHPMSRADDQKAQLEMVRLGRELGILLGVEGAMDFLIPQVDFLLGPMSLARFHFIEQAPAPFRFNLNPRLRVPLLNLVFHSGVDVTWHAQDSYVASEDNGTRALFDLLYGNPPCLTLSHPGTIDVLGDRIASLCRTVCTLHRQTARQEMELHGWLTDDRLVQMTRFRSGIQVVANFSRSEYRLPGGEPVAPGSCKVLLPREPTV